MGTYFLAHAYHDTQIHHWRDEGQEVDFVIDPRGRLAAIEVQPQGVNIRWRGLDAFCIIHSPAKHVMASGYLLPLGELFMQNLSDWVV